MTDARPKASISFVPSRAILTALTYADARSMLETVDDAEVLGLLRGLGPLDGQPYADAIVGSTARDRIAAALASGELCLIDAAAFSPTFQLDLDALDCSDPDA